jgi:hypothetical protein
MKRDLWRRISQAEGLLSGAVDKRLKDREQIRVSLPSLARIHATAVAAIVLHGEAKFGEPLQQSWTRVVTRHYTRVSDIYRLLFAFDTRDSETAIAELDAEELKRVRAHEFTFRICVDLAKQTYSEIMEGGHDEAEKFTEIFKTAPSWLLKFTSTFLDAKLLKFDLPDLSAAP